MYIHIHINLRKKHLLFRELKHVKHVWIILCIYINIYCGGYESRLFLREPLAAAREKRGVSEAT